MKNILKSFGALLLIFLVSCNQTEDYPFETFENMEKGAFARLLSPARADMFFVLTDGPSSQFEISVEFYDENNGSNVTDYDWVVRYEDFTDPDNSTADAPFASIPSSAFNTSADGLPGATWSVSLGDAAAAVGKTLDQLNGGSRFVFNATLKTNAGQEFTAANTGSNIQSSAPFSGFFFFNASLVCESSLAGTYTYVSTDLCAGDGSGGCSSYAGTLTGEVTWTELAGATGAYTTSAGSFGFYPELGYDEVNSDDGGNSTGTINDACNFMSSTIVDQYGDPFTYVIEGVSGADLTLSWSNTWGDAATVVVTRTDGTDWPPLQ